MNAEFFAAVEQLEKEKGIPADYMLDRVGQALITAYKRDNAGMTDNVYVVPDREKKEIRMFVRKTVVEDVYEPYLMQLGFLTRTPRGRCVTQKAYQHLHKPIPGGAAEGPLMDQLTF